MKRGILGRPWAGRGILAGALVFAGCQTPTRQLGQEVRIDGVPVSSADEPDACAVAALESVLRYWGEPLGAPEIAREVCRTEHPGVTIPDMLTYLNRLGFEADLRHGSLDDLRAEVRRGHPTVVFLKNPSSWAETLRPIVPPWLLPILRHGPRRAHVVLVIGFHKNDRYLVCHSGAKPTVVIAASAFDEAWAEADRAMIVVTPQRSHRVSGS